MTSGEAVQQPQLQRMTLPTPPAWLTSFYSALSPRQGWTTYLILLGALLVVAVTVAQAEWTKAPGLIQIAVYASLAGMWLAKPRWKWGWPILILTGLLLGGLVVFWKVGTLVPGEPLFEQWRMVGVRLHDWYAAATTGGISTDLLPFTMLLLGGAWVLGFFSAYFLFRRNNFWVTVVLGGVSLFTHVSFLETEPLVSFFTFVLLAMLLIVRMTTLQGEREWEKQGIQSVRATGWTTLGWGLGVTAAVLAVAALLPADGYVVRPVAKIWTKARSPVENLEGGFTRLVTGVNSKKNLPGRLFGENLPFLGAIKFNGEIVFWADTEYPSYWLNRTYSEYTSKGWVAGKTEKIGVGPETVFPSQDDSLKRTPIPQRVQVQFTTEGLLTGGELEWLSRDAVIETLAPKEFKVDMFDPTGDAEMPEDIRKVAQDLRTALNTPVFTFAEATIARQLPKDVVVTKIGYLPDGGNSAPQVVSVTLQRKDPITPEIVSFKFTEELPKENTYAMVSLVSTATDDDLRSASTQYSSTIRDHYLQLPSKLPQRVRDLAAELTKDAPTPLDKALAIEAYLRSSEFTYSQDIEAPPDGADGVDHFLFETKTGYSDYFASSMAVLLRAVGVPARMAAGYAPGDPNIQNGLLAVRDSDSHGWVQAYFPGYGWIDFEPTPNWDEHDRVMGLQGDADALQGFNAQESEERGELDRFQFPAEISNIGLGRSGLGNASTDSWRPGRILIVAGSLVGAVVVLFLLIQGAWRLTTVGLTPVERTYANMGRLGTLAGIHHTSSQTPWDFAQAVGRTVPRVKNEAMEVAWHFSASRYGRREPTEEEYKRMTGAWKAVRSSLVRRSLRRLRPFGRRSTA